MWNRVQLKEEAKKVSMYKDNYWKLVLAALIFILVTGGVGGAFSGLSSIPSTIMSVRDGSSNSSSHRKDINNDYNRVSTVSTVSSVPGFDKYEEYFEKYYVEPDVPSNNHKRGWFDSEYAIVVVVIVLFVLVFSIIGLVVAFTFKAFLINPILLGIQSLFLRSYDRPSDLKDLGNGFKNNYLNNVKTMFLRDIFTFLWALLFIVPGIIKAYEYRMIPYLISENPDMSYQEAFAKSKQMMMGNKWDTFVLDLSFLGWFILNSITCGILGVFYVNPYYLATDANLYRALKQ